LSVKAREYREEIQIDSALAEEHCWWGGKQIDSPHELFSS